MRPFLPAITAAAAAAIALAPAASDSAARVRESISLDRTCYVVGKHNSIHVTGKNFTPSAPFHVYSGAGPGKDYEDDYGVVIDVDGTTGPDGSISIDIPTPNLEKGDMMKLDLSVKAGTSAEDETWDSTKVDVTSFTAGFYSFEGSDYFMVVDKNSTGALKQGSVKKYRVDKKVNFFGFGFNDGKMADHPAFLFIHYVNPSGKSVADVYEATARGCGAARTLSGHPLFDRVKKPRPGLWKLQFDWNKKYKKNAAEKRVLYVKVDKKGGATFPGNYTRYLGD